MSSKDNHRNCEVCGQRERRVIGKAFYAAFPIDLNRCKRWLMLVGKKSLLEYSIERLHKYKFVCEMHFDEKLFNRKRNRLKRTAVPTLNLTRPPLTEDAFILFPPILPASSNALKDITNQTTYDRHKNGSSALKDITNQTTYDRHENGSSALKDITNQTTYDRHENGPRADNVGTIISIDSAAAVDKSIKFQDSKEKRINILENDLHVARQIIEELRHQIDSQRDKIKDCTNQSAIKLRTPQDWQRHAEDLLVENCKLHKEVARLNSQLANHTNSTKTSATMSTTRQSSTVVVKTTQHSETDKSSKKICEGHSRKRKLSMEEQNFSPRKKKLMEQLSKTKCTLQSLKRSAIIVENLESTTLKEIISNAARNQTRHPKGNRWTIDNKIAALSILKRSPKTYRHLRQFIPLPHESTLHKILKMVPMEPGINSIALKHLSEISLEKDHKRKMCCLLFDEIALKPRLIYNPTTDYVEGYTDFGELRRQDSVADHALVFMLQGIGQKFKQPIAFYFIKGTVSKEKLASLIQEIISKVCSTGYTIVNTVCDQGPTNMGALNILKSLKGLDSTENYFYVDDKKIYIIYDVPHLFKSLRNNFFNHGAVEYDRKTAHWTCIEKVEEKNRRFLYFSKIRKIHVCPKYRAKMKVKYAAQILSNTTAAILNLMAEADTENSRKLQDSAHVVREFDVLFDCLNGPSGPKDIKKGIRQNVSGKTNHLDLWVDKLKKLDQIKFYDKNGKQATKIKCISGFIISLKSYRDIWNHLKSLGFKYLNLRQLNQDSLENLFGVIRQHCPTNNNPTCTHFIAALKTSVVTKMTAHHSRGSNCEKDNNKILTDFKKIIFSNDINKNNSSNPVDECELVVDNNEYPVFCIPEQNESNVEKSLCILSEQPAVYVAGYLAYTLLKQTKCPKCIDSIKVDNPAESNIYNYIKLREWWADKQSLTYPSIGLCKLVQSATAVMENDLRSRMFECNIGQLTVTAFMTSCDTRWFQCTTHSSEVLNILYTRLACLFIRRHCQIINESYENRDEKIADTLKKAQQLGS